MKSEAEYLAQLVKFPTVSGDHVSAKICAGFCAKFFSRRGMHTKIIRSGDFYNLIATTKKTKQPKVFLQAHLDVVAAENAMFNLSQAKGNLTGRGVYDMKFACASYMKLVDSLRENIHEYDFGIMLTFDEEIGGANGVKFLLDEGYSCQVCILPDGGDNWKLESSANGAWFVRLVADGKTAHGSRPEEGVNAASSLTAVTTKILQKYSHHASLDGITCALTGLQAGEAINQIPDHAEASFDIRFRDRETYDSIKQFIDDTASNGMVRVETIDYTAPISLDETHPAVAQFKTTAQKVLGEPLESCHSFGCTDGRFFAKVDIPCIIIRPRGGGAHADGEWLHADDLPRFTDLLTSFVTSYAVTATVSVSKPNSLRKHLSKAYKR